ncbi:MAG: alanine racemase, partial [Bacteroidia bacterium]|nr:alanine racemase [Bacteroidia bacterium]
GVSKLIGIGPHISGQSELFKDIEKQFFQNTKAFLNQYKHSWFKDETILIKGARMFGFEKISEALQQKAHETVMEINLNSITDNLNYFRSKLQPETKVMAMVKAFSYGSGSFEIANILQFHRVDYLAVAYADEGMELREAGITVPILVLNPQEKSYNTIIDYYLEPEIYSFRLLESFAEALKRNDKTGSDSQYPVHLKLDTGMHRLGFELADINELILRIKNYQKFKIVSVFSHLAASEDPAHDDFTNQQIDLFKQMSNTIAGHFNYPIMRHILNSAGIVRFPEAHFEMVRLGIGMYGISTAKELNKKLKTVTSLKSSISQIKTVEANESVGYARAGASDIPRQIATIGIGYADGLDRRLGNGVGHLMVNGKKATLVGNVCMDMCMIDITGINVKEGDEVEIFGDAQSLNEIAEKLDTISYEVLSSIPPRVKRIYFQE